MSSEVGLLIGTLIAGIFIGIIIANTTSEFSVELTPNNSFKAAFSFS